MLRVATAAARSQARIGRRSLDRLAAEVPQWPERWPAGAIDMLVGLLLEGHQAIPVIEALDQRGLISRMLPEWEPVRSRPQRNAYHRFTVDRHLWETAANAPSSSTWSADPICSCSARCSTTSARAIPVITPTSGMELVRRIGPRLGLGERDVAVLVQMVQHHLLLPDVAVRRDLSDPATIQLVADAMGEQDVLELLHALTIADSKATGPSAWGPWKEELVADLVSRVTHVFGGGDVQEATWTLFPDAETLAMMATGEHHVRTDAERIVVVYRDAPWRLQPHRRGAHAPRPRRAHRPGPLRRAAARPRQHGCLRVSRARAEAWSRLGTRRPRSRPRAVRGELAIESRLAERARTYRRRRAMQAQRPGPPQVIFHDDASSNATVIEVRCTTKIGILHRITKALAEVGLDIRHATVQTVGLEVVDTFYVRNWSAELITDPAHRVEIERAILHAVV